MPPPSGGEWEPLPPPPATGWEQATILAAGLTPQPDAWLRAVLAANPTLAGRCLVEGGAQVSSETRATVQQALLADLSDPALHCRTRIQAGRVLAQVGDPRLTPVELNGVKVILPDLVAVPGGSATLGSAAEEAYDDEQPVHQVEVAPFYLGRWPVTNAEYGCFIQAGGYDEERYWTAAGWQWRQGKLEMSGAVENIMEIYQALVQNPELIDQALSEGRVTQDWAESWRGLIELPEERVKALAVEQYGQRRTDQPFYWDDPAYNQANQPVVGVTWYEALAYCAWLEEGLKDWINSDASAGDVTLNEVKGLLSQRRDTGPANRGQNPEVRLPTEAEWEWAAGGPQHRTYPWGGDFDPDKANTLEGRVLGATPVGAYPAGVASSGALDLAGNVWEWTSSLYRSYPYLKADDREAVEAEGRRVLRGGSWTDNQRYARVSYRDTRHPGTFDSIASFRVVVAPV
jgi:formylglycine-generating enzyme required for sulfatase activity